MGTKTQTVFENDQNIAVTKAKKYDIAAEETRKRQLSFTRGKKEDGYLQIQLWLKITKHKLDIIANFLRNANQ